RIDRSPYSRSSAGALLQFAASRQTGNGVNAGAAGSQATTVSTTGGVVQIFTSEFTKSRELHDTRLTAYVNRLSMDPQWLFPSVSVLVPPSAASAALRSVRLGGNPSRYADVTSGIELRREHQKVVGDKNKHRLKYGAAVNLTGSSIGDGGGVQQSFAYRSLAALRTNAPEFASASQNLGTWREQTYGLSGWLGDTWSKTKSLQLLIGGRVDADFADLRNSALVRSVTGEPSDLHDVTYSPRIGFRWIKWGPRFHTSEEPLGLFPSETPNLFRGGVGLFRSSWPVAPALSQLTQSSALLASRSECINPATGPDWTTVDGGSSDSGCEASLTSQPRYTAASISPSYKPPRSIRASVGWSRPTKRVVLSADATLSLNLDQPDWVDQKFSGSPAFSLANGRPVYVPLSNIDAASGSIPPRDAVPGQADYLHSLGSNARSLSRQLMLEMQSTRTFLRPFWAVTYVLSQTTGRMRGFRGTTAGDPLEYSNGPTSTDVAHQLIMRGGMYLPRALTLSAYVKLRSGLPYTPIMGGDVNGDGYANDRAFVDPAYTLAGDKSAIGCLRKASGRIIGSNACRGPWQGSAIVRIDGQGQNIGLPKRATLSLIVSNPLAAISRTHWGSAAGVDPVAYHVAGFSPATRTFELEPNSHFGRPALFQNATVALQVSLDLSKPMDVQRFGKAIEDASSHAGSEERRVSAVQTRYAKSVPDIFEDIREASDSLFLSRAQYDSLGEADIPYRHRMDSLWHGLAEAIVVNSEKRTSSELLQLSRTAVDSAQAITTREVPLIRQILSPSQLPYLPEHVIDVMNGKPVTIYYFNL
ncbi:MAG: hypothetical protein ABI328_00455, partial [Gemmatimonadaceae bacterium]